MSKHPKKSEEKRLQRALDRRRPLRPPQEVKSSRSVGPSPAASRVYPKG